MTHHILIASEQLWPNLLGLAALRQRDGGVLSLHILHTEDKKRSADPARQLAILADKMQPGLQVSLHATGMTSQEVIGVVHGLLNATPQPMRWSINATGGLKTMFAGLIPWVRLPGVEAFYREITGAWFHLTPMEVDGLQLVGCEEWKEAEAARLDWPVEQLATIQTDHPEGATWRHQKPVFMDVSLVVQDGVRLGWNWPELQKLHPALGSGGSGFAFEAFFGALLKTCGADNTVLNLELWHEGKSRQEFDAIVSTGEKIIVFDLKLTESEPDAIINQISRLGEDRRSLGGLNALAVAVRPNWSPDPARDAIARSHHVDIWTLKDMPQILAKISAIIGRSDFTTNVPLLAIQTALEKSAADGGRLFSQSRYLPASGSGMESQIGWLNLNAYWQECWQQERRAMVLNLGGRYLVRASVDLPGWRTREELQASLPKGVRVTWIESGKEAKSQLAMLSSPPEQFKDLKNYLHCLLRKQPGQADFISGSHSSTPADATAAAIPPRSNLVDAFKNFKP